MMEREISGEEPEKILVTSVSKKYSNCAIES